MSLCLVKKQTGEAAGEKKLSVLHHSNPVEPHLATILILLIQINNVFLVTFAKSHKELDLFLFLYVIYQIILDKSRCRAFVLSLRVFTLCNLQVSLKNNAKQTNLEIKRLPRNLK